MNIPAPLTQKLHDLNAEVTSYTTAEEAQVELDATHLDAVITMNGTAPQLTLEGSDPSKNKAVLFLLQSFASRRPGQLKFAGSGHHLFAWVSRYGRV